MKKYLSIAILFIAFISCKTNQDTATEEVKVDSVAVEVKTSIFPEAAKNLTVYEVNIRQYSKEGTINAFAQDLPRLKDLGVGILWIMPVSPISVTNRKGELGSYYAISSFRDVNPEFGTFDDFKAMVKQAHELGFYVILDWVPNHTGWDHPWIKEHPEYYAKDEEGNITHEADWTDIALLDHSSEEMNKEMISDMEYWVKETDIDGFRCDHAGHEIPMSFWEDAIPQLNSIKDLFWLAEWDEPKMHPLFNATYEWELFHLTNAIAKGEKNPDSMFDHIMMDQEKYGKEPFRLMMTTNHDENSWNGTVFERYGKADKLYATMIFTISGMPMIYNGQEVGLNKRLEFFKKDNIDWSDPKGYTAFYKSLVALRKNNPALNTGIYSNPVLLGEDDNESVLSYARKKDDNLVKVVLNLSNKSQKVSIFGLEGTYYDYFKGDSVTLDGNLTMGAFEYKVYIK